jgi:hypothetical protein
MGGRERGMMTGDRWGIERCRERYTSYAVSVVSNVWLWRVECGGCMGVCVNIRCNMSPTQIECVSDKFVGM